MRVGFGFAGALLTLGAAMGCDVGGTTRPEGSSGMSGSAAGAPSSAGAESSGGSHEGGKAAAGEAGKSEAGTDNGGAGGTASGGSSTAGSAGSGGTAGGGGSGGGGGTAGGGGTGGGECNGAQVLFAIQRSGAMFEQPTELSSYWSMLEDALSGNASVLAPYDAKLSTGALSFVKVLTQSDPPACPVLSSTAPKKSGSLSLGELFSNGRSAYEAAKTAKSKLDAPVPEAVLAASKLLSGKARHLVLITSAVPDSCSLNDTNCAVDPAITGVQAAHEAGVTTHVIGMGDTLNLNSLGDTDGYLTYLTQLANAGAGKPVKMSPVFEYECKASWPTTATYAETNGDAHAYRVKTSEELRTALAEILKGLCP